MSKSTMVKLLAKSRLENDHSADQAAGFVGCSREYLYDVLKYPDKSPEIYKKACEYITNAGEDIPADKLPEVIFQEKVPQ